MFLRPELKLKLEWLQLASNRVRSVRISLRERNDSYSQNGSIGCDLNNWVDLSPMLIPLLGERIRCKKRANGNEQRCFAKVHSGAYPIFP